MSGRYWFCWAWKQNWSSWRDWCYWIVKTLFGRKKKKWCVTLAFTSHLVIPTISEATRRITSYSAILLLCLVCFAGSLYLGFWVWNGHVILTLVKGELWLFFLAGLEDSGMFVATGNDHDCRKAIALDLCISTSLLISRQPPTLTHLLSQNRLSWTAIPESNFSFNYYLFGY